MAQKVEPQISEAMAKRTEDGIAKVYVLSRFLVGIGRGIAMPGGAGAAVKPTVAGQCVTRVV
jgi:hypothetical protein